MTEDEARVLRKNGSLLYRQVYDTLGTTIQFCIDNYDVLKESDVQAVTQYIWDQSGCAETFQRLSSYGYKQLINDGWTPFREVEDE